MADAPRVCAVAASDTKSMLMFLGYMHADTPVVRAANAVGVLTTSHDGGVSAASEHVL